MASSSPTNTRSSRLKSMSIGKGLLSTRSSARNNITTSTATSAAGNHQLHNGNAHHNNHNLPVQQLQGKDAQQSNIGRRKRKLDDLELENGKRERDTEVEVTQSKKVKIAVEIKSRPELELGLGLSNGLGRTRSVLVKSTTISSKTTQTQTQTISRARSQSQRLATPAPITKAETTEKAEKVLSPPPKVSPPKKHRDHHEKVVNGIKHELDRLQPNAADLELKKDEKRKLRSQEDQWFKSELSAYLPEYDVVIGNIPKEENILELDTPIIIQDTSKVIKQPSQLRKSNGVVDEYPLKEFSDSLFTTLHNAKRVDFSFMDRNYKDEGGADPLSDEYFEALHRKPERLERTIRNADKGRAQHEKDQVMRLLEGLQGHDWLKLMGVTGVTESRKKEYEPARDHFINGCHGLIEKFRWWREEEKRRKMEKEAALAEAEEEEGEEEAEVDEEVDDNASDGDPPDYSDVDASAARQLHEEAVARSAPYSKASDKRHRYSPVPYELEKDFVSFFKKPHLREAALGKHRRSGRSAAAWGYQVPEVPEADFDLPSLLEECNDPDYLKMHARRKRRDRRVSKN